MNILNRSPYRDGVRRLALCVGPGMQPFGTYPIHIIVKNGRTMLLGVVDSAVDRQLAEVRAREVSGVFAVDNGLTAVNDSR
jgi:BON domain-containing protein